MTFYTTVKLIEELKLDMHQTQMIVSENAFSLKGTTANLLTDDYVSLMDLLYAMMLPSGNDAAQTIAENLGKLYEEITEMRKNTKTLAVAKFANAQKKSPMNDCLFIKFMNKHAGELGLYNTVFSNSHGMCCTKNYSTCEDISALCEIALTFPLFREIIKTKLWNGNVKRNNSVKVLNWENTNK